MIKQCVPWCLEGVDLQKSFENIGCDPESLLQVLRSFALNTKPLLEKIARPDREKLADYAAVMHGIKGTGRGIGAAGLGARASVLEKAARAGDFDSVAAGSGLFLDDARRLLENLDALLRKIALENPKPKKAAIDPAVLSALRSACEHYDMDGVDSLMAKIESYEYESDNDTAEWLRTNINVMNFAEIIKKINKREAQHGN